MQYDLVEPREVEQFLNEIIDDSDLSDLAPEVRQILVADLKSTLKAKITGEITRRLTAEKCRAIEALVENRANLEKIQAVIKESIPNIENIIAGSMLEFRSKFIPN